MAVIKPFRGWRYAPKLTNQISRLISPPFDVVSFKQRVALYQEPYNSIHLSVPKPGDSAQNTAQLLSQWKTEGVLRQDTLAALYTYYQCFQLPGLPKFFCRKGFIAMIEATFWEENIVLRHEDTIPSSVNDRADLLAATQLHASPTHGLYTDAEHRLEPLIDQSMTQVIYEAEDYQGVRDMFGMITDSQVIQQFVSTLRDKPIILADGHHRYEGSLIHRRASMKNNLSHTGKEGYNYHMMYLTNTESEDLVILPTHRLISDLPNITTEAVLQKIADYFTIIPVENGSDIPEIIAGKPWTFGLLIGSECYKIRLKPEAFSTLDWNLHPDVKALETVVLHHFFIDKVLGIPQKEQSRSPHIHYDRSFASCFAKADRQEVQMALITNGVSIEEVKKVCYSGNVMPQKSTYFYPKAIGGFVFGSIHDDEL
ncbi:DUF1015 domain-containing protein [Tunicatimonas pelagia]|uniref:DUF1015 domain-containing protein n=1 Tax=Tunicatimonas pelagia TaxID=931531 RepID=UPI002666DF89|nr:DUF1015 domain-containing protein [Tunicatimonas pelagia]WKN41981.1 DUF1015 domain-containing protein [Tunicatimonas pelagia]